MESKNAPIAVFDSGVGGISVLRELVKLMPQENYLYFGDSANAPYGDKTTAHVQQLTLHAAQMLLDRGAKALVVACNTATAAAIDMLRQHYPNKILIGIEPALKMGADRFPHGRIGVMATQVTLREEKFLHQTERFPDPRPGLGTADRRRPQPADRPLFGRSVAALCGKAGCACTGLHSLPLCKGTYRKDPRPQHGAAGRR